MTICTRNNVATDEGRGDITAVRGGGRVPICDSRRYAFGRYGARGRSIVMTSWGRIGRRGQDLAVDLGTANTVVFRRGEGIVAFEPSVVAIDEPTGEVRAIGEQAR